MREKCFVWALAWLLAANVAAARNQDARPPVEPKVLRVLQAQEAVKIDGILDERIWQAAGTGDFVQTDPVDGGPPSERTTVWIAYDDRALYVAARMDDSQPDLIVAPLARRDALADEHHVWLQDSDWFEFSVDSYHDRLSGFHFAINPAGSIADATISNDTWFDYSWDGVWESAARRDSSGWTVEIRIPFDQLRFRSLQSPVWGVNFRRIIKRKYERDVLAWVPKNESGYVSRFAMLEGLQGMRQRLHAEFLPYGVARAEFAPAEAGNPFRSGHDYLATAGLDVKVGLQSNLTLDATVNPDFGQVEVDPAVVNLTAYETYFEEKRPFFIEGASIFTFGQGGATDYYGFNFQEPDFFYSRRIGRPPQGNVRGQGFTDFPDSSRIIGAAKITGKIGADWNIGFVSALTSREYARVDFQGERGRELVEPFSYYGGLRARKDFHQGRQGLGLIATATLRELDGPDLAGLLNHRAFVIGADGWSFLDKSKTWVWTGWLGASRAEGTAADILRLQESSTHYYQRPDADHLDYDPAATSMSGWSGRMTLNKERGNFITNFSLAAISPGFDVNDLGYMNRGDIINTHLVLGYRWLKPGRTFRNASLLLAKALGLNFGGTRIQDGYYLFANAQLLNYWSLETMVAFSPDTMSDDLTWGGPLMLHPSVFSTYLEVGSDDRKPVVLFAYGEWNKSGGGSYNWSTEIDLQWKPAPALSFSIGPAYLYRYSHAQWLATIDDTLMTATFGKRYVFSDIQFHELSTSLRLNWTFTPKLSLQAYIQPYLATGAHSAYKEFAQPRTFDFNHYGQNGSLIFRQADGYLIDPDGGGPAAAFFVADPDFNFKSLRGTIVLRWEYRPGSALYLVWTQNRSAESAAGVFDFNRDLGDLFRAPGDNIFLLKFTYRLKI